MKKYNVVVSTKQEKKATKNIKSPGDKSNIDTAIDKLVDSETLKIKK